MKLRQFILVVVVILLCVQSIGYFLHLDSCRADTPPTFYVGPGETYTTIQDALDNASDGYRIFVYNGTYYENLTITHRIDLFGEDRSITVINGDGADTVITVLANNVNISHFTITNGGTTQNDSLIRMNGDSSIITDNVFSDGYHGIYLNHSDHHLIYDNVISDNIGDGIHLNTSQSNTNISYNTVTGNGNGVYLYFSDSNKIYDNIICSNSDNGIFLNSSCDSNYIVDNNCSYNSRCGIYLNDYSNYSTISTNQVHGNIHSGIVLENCSWTVISNENIVQSNTNYGIMVVGSSNTIQSNTITSNRKDGMYLSADDNNTISSNTLSFNRLAGIRLYNSTNDYIYTNEINNNTQYGIYLDFFAISNVIYNNFLHYNGDNAIDKSLNRNRWNITKTLGTNIIGGGNLSGNYWDDYDEISEGALDSNADGIADSPYTIYTVNTDKGALLDTIDPSIGTPQMTPSSQTLGKYTNLSVTITDNTFITGVYLNVITPSGVLSNVSITANKTGSTYKYTRIFTPTGNYTYYITATDPRNWAHSANYSFSIRPGNPPSITDNSPTTAAPSADYLFNTTVTSTQASADNLRVYAVWSHGNSGGNYSLTNSAGSYFTGTVTLAHSITDMTYHVYATDQWGNDATTATKTVTITDTQPPVIFVDTYGPSFDTLPNSYTFGATITDDSEVDNVTIEYWYGDGTHLTATMDVVDDDYYEKVIVPEGNPTTVYCIITATDVAGNSNDTKNPRVKHGGPYEGCVLQEMTFNGSGCFDLDGTITDYSWSFGDGALANGSTPTHVYYSNGTYTVTLTVTDNEGNQGTNTTTATVILIIKHQIPVSQLTWINTRFNLTLSEQFYCYDADADGNVDTFVDPNNVLTVVHDTPVNLTGNILFLLSIGDDAIPEFFWNTTTDQLFPINHLRGIINSTTIEDEQATVEVIVEKDRWIYIELTDLYPHATLQVTTGNRTIADEFVWREDNTIYVFDDPETQYFFVFTDIYPDLTVTFVPADGGVINKDTPTITITYNTPVLIMYAAFNASSIVSDLATSDNMRFTYTPPGYLENGTYPLEIDAQSLQGNKFLSSTVIYFYFCYVPAPQKSFAEQNLLWFVLGGLLGALGGLLFFFKVKHVTIDGFLYIKNRKIIPFFKPVIVGPVSIHIPDERLSRAEFYVDGQLKEETTTFPALWQWNEQAFLKHTLETKVYDEEGNSSSSGQLEFYIFNIGKGKQS